MLSVDKDVVTNGNGNYLLMKAILTNNEDVLASDEGILTNGKAY